MKAVDNRPGSQDPCLPHQVPGFHSRLRVLWLQVPTKQAMRGGSDGSSNLVPAPMRVTWAEFPAPGSAPAQLSCCWASGE